jgi:hypothetical protein
VTTLFERIFSKPVFDPVFFSFGKVHVSAGTENGEEGKKIVL